MGTLEEAKACSTEGKPWIEQLTCNLKQHGRLAQRVRHGSPSEWATLGTVALPETCSLHGDH